MYHLLTEIKKNQPLVVHYTNEVTINDCANMTLAIGASPLMSFNLEEVDDLVRISSSVVINIGTMNTCHLDIFKAAGLAANRLKKPIILDPVGVFATSTRSNFVKQLLEEIHFDVIKGNLAEIKFIGGLNVHGSGADSYEDDVDENSYSLLKSIALKFKTIIVATGKKDIITDGTNIVVISNGASHLKSITGTGCMTASLIASYLTVSEPLDAATMGVLSMSIAGEQAQLKANGLGDFKIQLFNEVSLLTEDTYKNYAKVVYN
ncbi:MAG: hydroxyethylthiazole kinase [Cellulosilyticaceae bacterium]